MAKYLLDNGLKNFEGVVFLDEFDRKMILVRATGRVLKLAQCGISEKKRFAFYDQVTVFPVNKQAIITVSYSDALKSNLFLILGAHNWYGHQTRIERYSGFDSWERYDVS